MCRKSGTLSKLAKMNVFCTFWDTWPWNKSLLQSNGKCGSLGRLMFCSDQMTRFACLPRVRRQPGGHLIFLTQGVGHFRLHGRFSNPHRWNLDFGTPRRFLSSDHQHPKSRESATLLMRCPLIACSVTSCVSSLSFSIVLACVLNEAQDCTANK